MNRKTIILAAALMCAAASAQAQDLNPTVSVTNIYKGKVKDTAKWQSKMTVPDSLYSFDYKFDYTVKEKAYTGGNEFTPYAINMRPSAGEIDDNVLYLRAGAGYLLKPELHAFYSPRLRGAARVSVSDDFSGFFGPTNRTGYHPVLLDETASLAKLAGVDNKFYSGYDFSNDARVDLSLDFSKVRLDFRVSDDMIGVKDTLGRRLLNGVNFNARVKGKSNWERYVYYDGGFDLRVAKDNLYGRGAVNEVLWGLNATAGPVLDRYNRILVDVNVQSAIYRNLFRAAGTVFSMGMRYELSGDRGFASLGAGYDVMILPKGCYDNSKFPFHLFPDVKASYTFIQDALITYAQITGGTKLNTYSGLAKANHHFDYTFGYAGPAANALLQASREVVAVKAGLKGQVFSSVNYDISASYDVMGNSPMTSVTCLGYGTPSQQLDASILYTDYNLFHADAQIGYIGKSVKANLAYRYQKQSNVDNGYMFLLPEHVGTFSTVYNWHNRIHAGVWTEVATARKGDIFLYESQTSLAAKVPGYVDLGLYADYAFTSKLTFWIQGGNLLGQNIQRNILYAEPGRNVVAGICINL